MQKSVVVLDETVITWQGRPIRREGLKTYYTAVTKGSTHYRIGDCVHVKARGKPRMIVQLKQLWQTDSTKEATRRTFSGRSLYVAKSNDSDELRPMKQPVQFSINFILGKYEPIEQDREDLSPMMNSGDSPPMELPAESPQSSPAQAENTARGKRRIKTESPTSPLCGNKKSKAIFKSPSKTKLFSEEDDSDEEKSYKRSLRSRKVFEQQEKIAIREMREQYEQVCRDALWGN